MNETQAETGMERPSITASVDSMNEQVGGLVGRLSALIDRTVGPREESSEEAPPEQPLDNSLNSLTQMLQRKVAVLTELVFDLEKL